MEQISRPLKMTEAQNREALRNSEERRRAAGDPEGNRHDRRVAAKRARQQAREQARKMLEPR